ncbi:MAG: hypothetical protein MI861_14680, partial [Pirellulales bacterium]|nr:hypothetical protein [Pirellulales bacterium]
MSGRRRRNLSPSLFPFLAVLVCTLGTLILLLALVAQNATDSADQAARAQQQSEEEKEEHADEPARLPAKRVLSLIEEEQFRVEQLVAFRDAQTDDLEQRRDQLTHLEDHISRLTEKLQRLSDEIDQATGKVPTNVIDQSAIAELKQEVAEQERLISELKQSVQQNKPRVVIVPHQGPNGTERRPIYVECHAQGVTIWPEGSQITTRQLADSVQSANPLDGALRAVRYHSLQKYGDDVPPYPLLVVRPDGIEAYAVARRAMLDWDDQFGYELVPAETKLAFPNPDSNLKQRIDQAIRQAVAQQHSRHALARRSAGGYDRRLPTLSAAALDRQSRAQGFRPHRGTYGLGGRSPYTHGSGRPAG